MSLDGFVVGRGHSREEQGARMNEWIDGMGRGGIGFGVEMGAFFF